MQPSRLVQLDYLRGLAAFGIMLFHFISFSYGERNADSALGRIGLYGVSIFYVLSGLTLTHVYHEKLDFSLPRLRSFFVKRIFRIIPLFAIATLLTVLFSKQSYSLSDVLLNITCLFGLVDYTNNIALGSWSIGNEWVFYFLLPLFLVAFRTYRWLYWSLVMVALLFLVGFAFLVAMDSLFMRDYWIFYIHPLNQLMLFISGVVIFHLFHDRVLNQWVYVALMIVAIIIFIAWPASGDRLVLVSGIERLVFSFCSVVLCLGIYKWRAKWPKAIHGLLSRIGDASFSIYMLHPIVWILVSGGIKYFGIALPLMLKISIAIVLTLVLSSIVYQQFEKRFIRWGNSLISKG